LKDRLPACTIVSIAHRPTVAAFHQDRVELRRNPDDAGKLIKA